MRTDYRNSSADIAYERLSENLGLLPFCFTYAGKKYKGFSSDCFSLKERSVERIEDKETQKIVLAFSELNV